MRRRRRSQNFRRPKSPEKICPNHLTGGGGGVVLDPTSQEMLSCQAKLWLWVGEMDHSVWPQHTSAAAVRANRKQLEARKRQQEARSSGEQAANSKRQTAVTGSKRASSRAAGSKRHAASCIQSHEQDGSGS